MILLEEISLCFVGTWAGQLKSEERETPHPYPIFSMYFPWCSTGLVVKNNYGKLYLLFQNYDNKENPNIIPSFPQNINDFDHFLFEEEMHQPINKWWRAITSDGDWPPGLISPVQWIQVVGHIHLILEFVVPVVRRAMCLFLVPCPLILTSLFVLTPEADKHM